MTHPATLLKNSWRAYARDFRAWLILTAPVIGLAVIAVGIINLLPQNPQGGIDFSTSAAWVKPLAIIGALVAAAAFILVARIFSTALIISSYRSLNGQKPNIKESIKVGWRTFWPVLWVAILRDLIILGGLILLIVPGIIWGLRYSLAVQAAVIEDKRGLGALHRSKDLTSGKLLATFINFGVINMIISYGTWIAIIAVAAVFIVLGAMVAMTVANNGVITAVAAVVATFAAAVTVWFIKPLFPIAATSVYKDYSDK
jgi:hypothetical protein